MPVTGLILIQDPSTNATTITAINDQITHLFPRVIGKWSLEYKLFRENPVLDHSARHSSPDKPQGAGSRFLSQLFLSHHPDDLFCLVDEPQSHVPGHQSFDKKVMTVFDKGMDMIITSKLSSIWILRQSMRAEGVAYAVGDEFVVRTANVTQAGSFRCIVVEIEYLFSNDLESSKIVISDFATRCGLPDGKFFFGDTVNIYRSKADEFQKFTKAATGLQYMEAFRARPNG
ncbi:mediator complex, subunit Med20 [Lipomyces kononenkoae]|uniref:Mediator complex, subunit Med20 n=1 Tax=Lipomyces kononenkoae TaxID=34357 RepID=A0ACC3SZX6_LIPKO